LDPSRQSYQLQREGSLAFKGPNILTAATRHQPPRPPAQTPSPKRPTRSSASHAANTGVPSELLPAERHAKRWVVADARSSDPIPVEVGRRRLSDVVGLYRALRDWCREHGGGPDALLAFDSLSRLAAVLVDLDPDAVIDLFDDLERHLKFSGDINIVMRFGRLAERACARTQRRGRRIVEFRTQATTCAVAWVQQRVGLLQAADNQLLLDERLNRDAEELRGLAFTLKCRGRLRRLMSERSDYAPTPELQRQYLIQSIADLTAARDTFQSLSDGDRMAQVADTDALLARTHFSAGDLERAKQSLEMATLWSSIHLGKTAFDCLILSDELEAAIGLKSSTASDLSIHNIQQVIDGTNGEGYETNEIRARALFAAAKILSLGGTEIERYVEEALQIYRRLVDHNAAASIRLWKLRQEGLLGEPVEDILRPYPPDVKIRAFDAYCNAYGKPVGSALINRSSDDTDPRWRAVIRDAKASAAQHFEVFE
jgi:hypothetical protein